MKARRRGDVGFTLIEVLVAIALFSFLSTALMSVLISTSKAVTAGKQVSTINEEARLALERITREVRQAKQVVAVRLPTPTDATTSMTLWVDFNGNNLQDDTAADPEIVTYAYDPAAHRLTLTANDQYGTAVTRPILAENVSAFTLGFRSSLYAYDKNLDGITDWTELDATLGVGNQNGILDGPELALIDTVTINLSVLQGTRQQTYQTQTNLRNLNQS